MLAAAPLLWAYPKGGRITLGVRSSCHGRCMARLGTPGSPQRLVSVASTSSDDSAKGTDDVDALVFGSGSVTGSFSSLHMASEPMGAKNAKKDINFSQATVLTNRSESLDGSLRTLVLSVADPMNPTLRRRAGGRPAEHPWLARYEGPGQFVTVRTTNATGDAQQRLHVITSTPYQSRSQSANLDAVIIEILTDKNSSEQDLEMASLKPGDVIEVSEPLGSGFAELFSSRGGLQMALEEGRPLLMVAVGARGIAAMRSAIEWTPVQAHATTCPVTLYYVADSQASAAYIKDWDSWRESGAVVNVLFTSNFETGESEGTGEELILRILTTAILGGEVGLKGSLRAAPKDATVLMAGLQGTSSISLLKKLHSAGVETDRFLFCEYF